VVLSITSTDFREINSVLRSEPGRVRFRSKLYFTASPSSGSPSSNFRPGRSLIVSASLSSDHSYSVARLGMTCRSGVMSNSLAQNVVSTSRAEYERLSAGSSWSGSSLMPIRIVAAVAALPNNMVRLAHATS
jgi:hypothetical protein